MDSCSKKTEALREFVRDIEAVGLEHVKEEWPDLVLTYRNAKAALKGSRIVADPRKKR